MKKNREGTLSRDTKLLGANSFFTDVSTEMIMPILPVFITQVLGAPAFVLGIIEGWAEISVSVLNMLSGWLSDRFRRRKPLVVFGYSLSAASKPLFALAGSWQQVFFLRVLERAGKGMRRVPRDAIIASAEPRGNLGRAFGFRKMMDSAGAMAGPLITTAILFYFGGTLPQEEIYRNIFLLASVPAAIALLFLFFVGEKKSALARISRSRTPFSGDFSRFLAVASLFSLAQMGISFFILRGGDALPLIMVPVAYLGYNAAYTAFAMPAGMLTDALGPRKMLLAAYLLFALICFAFAFPVGGEAAFLLFGAMGLFMAIMETTPRTYLVRQAPGHRYATAIGTYQGVTGLLLLPANLVAGLLWASEIEGLRVPFLLSGSIAVLSALLLLFFVKDSRKAR